MAMFIDSLEYMDIDPITGAFDRRSHDGFPIQPCRAIDDTFCPSPESYVVQPGAPESSLLNTEKDYPIFTPQVHPFDKGLPIPARNSRMPRSRIFQGYDNATGRRLYHQTQVSRVPDQSWSPIGQVRNYQPVSGRSAYVACQNSSPDFNSSIMYSTSSRIVPFNDALSYDRVDSAMTDPSSCQPTNALESFMNVDTDPFGYVSTYSNGSYEPTRMSTSHHLLGQSKSFEQPINQDFTGPSNYTTGSTQADWPIAHQGQWSEASVASSLAHRCDQPDAYILPTKSQRSLGSVADLPDLDMHGSRPTNSTNASKTLGIPNREREAAQLPTSPNLYSQAGPRKNRALITKPTDELKIQFYELPTGKRKLETQASPKRNVWRKASSACFACILAKQACETVDDGACTRCQKVLKHIAHLMPLPTFTCNSRTIFASLSLFTSPYPQINTEDKSKTSAYPSPPPEPIALTIEPFVPILEALDPNIVRRSCLQSCVNPILTLSYLHNIIKWKGALLILFPEHSDQLTAIEQRYRDWIYDLLCYMDTVARGKLGPTTAISLFLFYDEICSLSSLPSVDQAAAQHLKNTVEHHMIFLRSSLLTPALPQEGERASKRRKNNHLRKAPDHELFLKLPHHLQLILMNSKTRQFLPPECMRATSFYRPEIGSIASPQCRILHSTPRNLPSNMACLCSLALHCLPADLFRPFGLVISAPDICRRIHRLIFQDHDVPKAVFMYNTIRTNDDQEALSWFARQYRQIISRLMECYFECMTAMVAPSTSRDTVLQKSKFLRVKWKDVFAKVAVYIPAYGMRMLAAFLDWVIETREDALAATPGDHMERWLRDSKQSLLDDIRGQMVYTLRKRLAKFDVALNLYRDEVKALES